MDENDLLEDTDFLGESKLLPTASNCCETLVLEKTPSSELLCVAKPPPPAVPLSHPGMKEGSVLSIKDIYHRRRGCSACYIHSLLTLLLKKLGASPPVQTFWWFVNYRENLSLSSRT